MRFDIFIGLIPTFSYVCCFLNCFRSAFIMGQQQAVCVGNGIVGRKSYFLKTSRFLMHKTGYN